MFKENELYKHKNARDVAILVQSVKQEDDGVEVFAYWANVHYNELGFRDPFLIGKPQRIFIHRNKLDEWEFYDAKANKGKLKS